MTTIKINPEKKPHKRLFSINDLASEIGATRWFWRTQIWDGKIPCVQVGRKMFVDAKDVDRFIEAHKV